MGSYPFDEFSADLAAISSGTVLRRGRVMQNLVRVKEYMDSQYDEDAGHFRFQRFMLIMQFLSSHIHELDQSDYAVFGSEQAGALVSDHVFRAVHEIFTTKELAEMKIDPTAADVMKLADKYRDAESAV